MANMIATVEEIKQKEKARLTAADGKIVAQMNKTGIPQKEKDDLAKEHDKNVAQMNQVNAKAAASTTSTGCGWRNWGNMSRH